MNDRLTSQHLSALFTLMAVAREINNTELEERTGIRITGDVRMRLNKLGLVTSTREGNKPFVHELTKEGWLRARAEFTAERPARPGYYGYAFFAVLNGLDRFLNRENRPLGDLFQPEGDDDQGLEAQIKRAYRRLAAKPGDWVSLADLRQLLNGAPKDEVDTTLKTLGRKQDVTLSPNPNRKVITDDDRAAAVLIGGDENHMIAIEES